MVARVLFRRKRLFKNWWRLMLNCLQFRNKTCRKSHLKESESFKSALRTFSNCLTYGHNMLKLFTCQRQKSPWWNRSWSPMVVSRTWPLNKLLTICTLRVSLKSSSVRILEAKPNRTKTMSISHTWLLMRVTLVILPLIKKLVRL